MKYFLLIITLILLQACTTIKLDPNTEARILLLTETNDQFYVAHDGYHFFSRFRPLHIFEGKPNWKLSEVFNEYILNKQNNSNFKFIVVSDEPVSTELRGPSSWYKKDIFKKLANQYSADYILILGAYSIKNDVGTVVFEPEYGFRQEVYKTTFLDDDIKTQAFMNARVHLIDTKNNTSSNCSGFNRWTYVSNVSSIGVPASIDETFSIDDISQEAQVKMYSEVRSALEGLILEALQNCRVLPPTIKKNKTLKYD